MTIAPAALISAEKMIGDDAASDAVRFGRTENGVMLITREMSKRLEAA